jgi:hypothetical protein
MLGCIFMSENKDPMGWQIMADAQKARRDAIREARIQASPYLLSLREAQKLYNKMQEEGKL